MFENHSLLAIGALGIALYFVCLVIYRLYLSPIARFPGPKITAISGWCEAYYDIVKGGQFSNQVQKWHERYGPIIRINVDELHVNDSRFFDVAYSSTPFDKLKSWQDRLGIPEMIASTAESDVHRRRRGALNPFFSKRQINIISPLVQKNADKMCDRLLKEYKGSGRPVCVNEMYAAFGAEIIMQYCFAWTNNYLDYPDFVTPFTTAIRNAGLSLHVVTHMRWVGKLMRALPDPFIGHSYPLMLPMLQFQNRIKGYVNDLLDDQDTTNGPNGDDKSVFKELLASNLHPSDRAPAHLQDTAAGVVGAAVETTKSALAVATFHILNKASIHQHLKQELNLQFPNLNKTPTLAELEQLPYLTAIIQEALRLSHGISQRLPRVSPLKPVYYGGYRIPPGTPFSMNIPDVHYNPTIFPDPYSFKPERWLESPRIHLPALQTESTGAEDKTTESKPLTNYLVAFNKGTRGCLGRHLALAELHVALATVFRKCNLELYKTGPEAVEWVSDFLMPFPRPETQGVRVKVV